LFKESLKRNKKSIYSEVF